MDKKKISDIRSNFQFKCKNRQLYSRLYNYVGRTGGVVWMLCNGQGATVGVIHCLHINDA